MSKTTKKVIIGIIVVILIFIIISVIYQKYQTKPIDANATKSNVLDDANTGLDNMLNQIFDNEINNNAEEQNNSSNVETNTSKTNTQATNTQVSNKEEQNENTQTEEDSHMTPRENKAIELVKKQWIEDMGSLDGVSFNVSIQNDGKYGVTVYDTRTTQTIEFYVVDVDTEIVKER